MSLRNRGSPSRHPLASRLTLLRYEDGGRGAAGSAAGRARELTETVDELCRVLAEARGA